MIRILHPQERRYLTEEAQRLYYCCQNSHEIAQGLLERVIEETVAIGRYTSNLAGTEVFLSVMDALLAASGDHLPVPVAFSAPQRLN